MIQSMDETFLKLAKIFQIDGEYLGFEEIGSGHINTTYCVRFLNEKAEDYIFQKINTYVFKDPVAVMENISSVTEFIRQKTQSLADGKSFLRYQRTRKGEYYHVLDDGSFWRCCRYIQNSKTFLTPENEQVVKECGRAFGEFQKHLLSYPVSRLNLVIPHFHNTILRFDALREAMENDFANRRHLVEREIDGFFALEEVACEPYKMQTRGELPLRVTHNDTKISNVLFDKDTGERLCVIDLDTVMPGLVAFDFGDAVRSNANTGKEDEQDLTKCKLDLKKYQAFTDGFLGEVGGFLWSAEKQSLVLGAVAMTVECGARFLTDYLNGDGYFRVHYENHNLVRARCQLALAGDMLKNFEKMQEIVEKHP